MMSMSRVLISYRRNLSHTSQDFRPSFGEIFQPQNTAWTCPSGYLSSGLLSVVETLSLQDSEYYTGLHWSFRQRRILSQDIFLHSYKSAPDLRRHTGRRRLGVVREGQMGVSVPLCCHACSSRATVSFIITFCSDLLLFVHFICVYLPFY